MSSDYDSYKRRAPKKLGKTKWLVHFHTKIPYDLSAANSQFELLKVFCRKLSWSLFEERHQPKPSYRVSCHTSFVRVPLRLLRPGDTRCANSNPDSGASSSHQARCGG